MNQSHPHYYINSHYWSGMVMVGVKLALETKIVDLVEQTNCGEPNCTIPELAPQDGTPELVYKPGSTTNN